VAGRARRVGVALARAPAVVVSRPDAVAFALLYLGRPVGWTLVCLDLVVCAAAWPALPRAGRALPLSGVLTLLLSHGAALVATGLGDGLPPLTPQPADRPWETWIVLPASWALVAWATRPTDGYPSRTSARSAVAVRASRPPRYLSESVCPSRGPGGPMISTPHTRSSAARASAPAPGSRRATASK